MTHTMYALLPVKIEEAAEWPLGPIYTTHLVADMMAKLSEYNGDCCVEIYEANEDNEFVDGSDFDTKEHFLERNRHYWLNPGWEYTDPATLYKSPITWDGTNEEVWSGTLESVGIAEDDPDWQEKLDRFFLQKFKIFPDQWEVG